MIRFILNDREVETGLPAGTLLLDYIRYDRHLTGTKIGCREGDCGACTVLVGEWTGAGMQYRSFTCCLTPLGNIEGRHVVTVEGLNMPELNPIQKSMSDCGATQCGFCTPGFVVSLAGFCLGRKEATLSNAIAAIDGNICRCTGYKSIERAAERVTALLQNKDFHDPVSFVVNEQILPAYFADIPARLQKLLRDLQAKERKKIPLTSFMGGGTDLYVHRHEELLRNDIHFLHPEAARRSITRMDNCCVIGPAATVTDLQESPLIREIFPDFSRQVKMISSTPIRNMATLAGNFINASPIGDFTVFFLAAGAALLLGDGEQTRELPLRHLYRGYKQLDKTPQEKIVEISFELPGPGTMVNFEKVSKRMHLDIASVNSALFITIKNGIVEQAGLAAGGVAPVPLYLKRTSAFLKGRPVSEAVVMEAVEVAQTEISPISDARGTAAYKAFLLEQLIKAHFLTLFPELDEQQLLHAGMAG